MQLEVGVIAVPVFPFPDTSNAIGEPSFLAGDVFMGEPGLV
jgi:hypothetical protein